MKELCQTILKSFDITLLIEYSFGKSIGSYQEAIMRMIDMVHGQRLLVRSLVEAKQGRRVIHVNQKVHIFKNIVDTYDLGKDRDGNFGLVLHNAIEGEHFELIPGELPFPDLKPLPPFDVFEFG